MSIRDQDCDELEGDLAALEREVAILQQILEQERDLSESQRARLRQRIFEIGQGIAVVKAELANCYSDFIIMGVEHTQGIQYCSITDQGTRLAPDNSVPLIALRPLVLRVYVDSKQSQQIGPQIFPVSVTGQLTIDRIRQNGSVERVTSLRPVNGSIRARSAGFIDRREADHTLNFRLAATHCRGLLRYTVQVFEQGPVVLPQLATFGESPTPPSLGSRASVPFAGTLSFTSTAGLRIRLVRIAYRNAARGFDLSAPTVDDFWSAAEYTRRTFPIPRIDLLRESVELYDGDFTSFFASGGPGARGTTGTIFEILDRLRSTEELSDDVRFVALIPGPPANQSAAGHAIRRRQVSQVNGPVLAQELAHDSGFPGHAPCGDPQNVDRSYPEYRTDVEASIGEVGFDLVTFEALDPGLYHDVMSYCGPKWISPYTYDKLLRHYKAAAATNVQPIFPQRTNGDAVTVAFALIDGKIANVHLASGVVTSPRASGSVLPFTVQIRDAAGIVVDSAVVLLDDPYQTPADRELHVSVSLPLRDDSQSLSILSDGNPLWETELPAPVDGAHAIGVTGPGAPQRPHTVAVKWKAPAGQREARLDYSYDDGLTWQTVAEGVSPGQHVIDTLALPGGDSCRIRAVVTNGCRVHRFVSEVFQVQCKPVPIAIISPSSGFAAQQGNSVQLLGESVGADRRRDPEEMNWLSNIDGFLGSGQELLIHTLSLGRHRITLSADDGLGGEVEDHVFIRVKENST